MPHDPAASIFDEMDPVEAAEYLDSLGTEREEARDLAGHLERIADALRAVAAGRGNDLDASTLRGHIDGYGELIVGAALDFDLLIRHRATLLQTPEAQS